MIINILRFAFKDEVTADQQEMALQAIRQTATLESVLFGNVGKYYGDPEDGFTHALVSAIKDLRAMQDYLMDPLHRAGDFIFLPLLKKHYRFAVSDDDPALLQEVGILYNSIMEKDAEWKALFNHIDDLKL